MSKERSKRKVVRDLADEFFVDLLLGKVEVRNPDFQTALEKRIDDLIDDIQAKHPRGSEASR